MQSPHKYMNKNMYSTCVGGLHVLLMIVLVFSRYSDFYPQSKPMVR